MYVLKVNGVDVGKISREDFQKIKNSVYKSPGMYFYQMINLLSVLANLTKTFLFTVPNVVFWFSLFLVWKEPGLLQDLIMAAQADPVKLTADILGFVQKILEIGILGTLIYFGICAAWLVDASGFENKFGMEINKRLRLHAGVAAEGTVTLVG